VETFRNVPLLVTIVFLYSAVALKLPGFEEALRPPGMVLSNRGLWVPWVGTGRGPGPGVVLAVSAAAAVAFAVLLSGRRRRRGGPEGTGRLAVAVFVVLLGAGLAASQPAVSVPQPSGRLVEGGLRLPPELAALLGGLVLYTSSHIAEIVRGSILAVPWGQTEAAEALGLSAFRRLQLVVIPQALRIMVPPLANQYLNLTKNSSLGVVIAYAELTLVTRTAIAGGSPAPQAVLLLMAAYLALSLSIAAVSNLVNRRLLAAWR
jgi:general L-amino acid transport system permease protein